MKKFWKAIDDFLGPGINRFPEVPKHIAIPQRARLKQIEIDLDEDDILVVTCPYNISDDHRIATRAEVERIISSAGRKCLIMDRGFSIQVIHRNFPLIAEQEHSNGLSAGVSDEP